MQEKQDVIDKLNKGNIVKIQKKIDKAFSNFFKELYFIDNKFAHKYDYGDSYGSNDKARTIILSIFRNLHAKYCPFDEEKGKVLAANYEKLINDKAEKETLSLVENLTSVIEYGLMEGR